MNYLVEYLRSKTRRSQRKSTYVGNRTVLTDTFWGAAIYLDSEDISLTPHLIRNGHWERHITRLLIAELKSGGCFLDVGANCGYFATLASKLVGENGTVIAIEPQAHLADLVSRSLGANGMWKRSFVANCAVGDKEGELQLYHEAKYRGSSSLVALSEFTEETSDTVKVKTVDMVIAEAEAALQKSLKPTVVKIDVEGFEPQVWQGMKTLLKQPGKLSVILEFTPRRYTEQGIDPEDFLKEIEGDGFAVHAVTKHGKFAPLSADERRAASTSDDFWDLFLTRDH